MTIMSAFQNYMMNRFIKKHEHLLDQAADFLVRPFEKWPAFTPSWTVVFGSGAVSGLLALKAADLAARGLVGRNIVFVGGLYPTKTLKANELIPLLEKAGIPAPKESETEAVYMTRLFRERTAPGKGEDENPTLSRLNVYFSPSDKSRNTAENLRVAMASGWEDHFSSVGLVTLPYHTYRTMATLKKVFENASDQPKWGEGMTVMPHSVWPVEIGIGPDNYRENPIAKYVLLQEYLKVGYPNAVDAPYVKEKGFCKTVDVRAERAKAEAYLRFFPDRAPK